MANAAADAKPRDWSWVGRAIGGGGEAEAAEAAPRLGLVLLNTPLAEARLRRLWALAELRVCADGAANRLLQLCGDLAPDILLGDFDSVTPEALEAYERRGVRLRNLAHDQDSTDLEKALAAVREAGFSSVLVAGQFAGVGGRLDHTFGIANALRLNSDLQVAVVGDDSHMFLLGPGEHQIFAPGASEAPHCGLVPLGEPCSSISTTGLQWNMTDSRMEFGGLVSVCNRLDPSAEGRVWVRTSSHVLWMCTLPEER
mmetsp:Transcript_5006/g.15434  ORF Transcript_5006/g.15434 Transcript_5006/m.15434 type:complete len:256 (-) Transcript_5006:94-861(-)